MVRSLCITHGKDVDGLSSAAIIKMVTNSDVILSDYDTIISDLKGVKNVDSLYICDLGMNDRTEEGFLKQVKRIRKFAKVSLLDHHPMTSKVRSSLEKMGVKLFHDLNECASVIVYRALRNKTKEWAKLLAAYGAITDYLDSSKQASEIIQMYDRQFLLLEATLLSHAIGRKTDEQFRHRMVDSLSKGIFPHQIPGVPKYSSQQAEKVSLLLEVVKTQGKKKKGLAYFLTAERSTGNVANLLPGAFGVKVGLSLKLNSRDESYDVSARGLSSFPGHLGDIMAKVSSKVGGYGGGHRLASGARIPPGSVAKFLNAFDKEVLKARS
ncbi:MAG: DHHA1 domain-containing protein [Nitrososphaerales archaeon]